MTHVYAFLAQGLEEVECLAVADILRRGGVDVTLVSIGDSPEVTGSHDITIKADILFKNVNLDAADVLFLPGGMPGTRHLREFTPLCDALVEHFKAGKRLAAICAAPSVLGELGLLKGRRAACYPGFEETLLGAVYTEDGVVTDGNITTARGLGYALDLGIELLRLLVNEETAQKVKAEIQYHGK